MYRKLNSLVVYLYVNGSVYLGWEERAFVCCCLPVIMWFLFGEVSSSSWCLGWATLFIIPYNSSHNSRAVFFVVRFPLPLLQGGGGGKLSRAVYLAPPTWLLC